jgi:hypothetical protein
MTENRGREWGSVQRKRKIRAGEPPVFLRGAKQLRTDALRKDCDAVSLRGLNIEAIVSGSSERKSLIQWEDWGILRDESKHRQRINGESRWKI